MENFQIENQYFDINEYEARDAEEAVEIYADHLNIFEDERVSVRKLLDFTDDNEEVWSEWESWDIDVYIRYSISKG